MILWLQFIVCTGLILYAGTKLTVYGDIIAEKNGLGEDVDRRGADGLGHLLAGTYHCISSVTLFDVPDIAAGDVLDSCMFNILISALLDILQGPTPISARANQGHVLTGAAKYEFSVESWRGTRRSP